MEWKTQFCDFLKRIIGVKCEDFVDHKTSQLSCRVAKVFFYYRRFNLPSARALWIVKKKLRIISNQYHWRKSSIFVFLGQYGYLITEQEKYLNKNQMARVIEKYN